MDALIFFEFEFGFVDFLDLGVWSLMILELIIVCFALLETELLCIL